MSAPVCVVCKDAWFGACSYCPVPSSCNMAVQTCYAMPCAFNLALLNGMRAHMATLPLGLWLVPSCHQQHPPSSWAAFGHIHLVACTLRDSLFHFQLALADLLELSCMTKCMLKLVIMFMPLLQLALARLLVLPWHAYCCHGLATSTDVARLWVVTRVLVKDRMGCCM